MRSGGSRDDLQDSTRAPGGLGQVAELRTAFPNYTFNLIRHRDETPRFEALSRDGGSPYCLISDDAREIWSELRGKD